MTEIPQGPEKEEIPVTPETLGELRIRVASLREQKGREEEALREARRVREGAKELEAHEDVVDLYWEEYLIGKGIVMDARDKKGLWEPTLENEDIARGFALMKPIAVEAQEYIEKHGVGEKGIRSGRFLGEVAMIEGDYEASIKHFEDTIEAFEGKEDFGQRVNALEIKGFLAEALTLSGEPERGIALTRQTYNDYEKGDGETLKDGDYYEWAVWRSGCVYKQMHALFAREIPVNDELFEAMVDLFIDTKPLLTFPEDRETDYGDKNFTKRTEEMEAIEREIEKRGFSVN